MPIRRWRGWAAYCLDCGQAVDLTGDGTVAFEKREEVKEMLSVDDYEGVDDAIRDVCGCATRGRQA